MRCVCVQEPQKIGINLAMMIVPAIVTRLLSLPFYLHFFKQGTLHTAHVLYGARIRARTYSCAAGEPTFLYAAGEPTFTKLVDILLRSRRTYFSAATGPTFPQLADLLLRR